MRDNIKMIASAALAVPASGMRDKVPLVSVMELFDGR